jgi:hypothetical protein
MVWAKKADALLLFTDVTAIQTCGPCWPARRARSSRGRWHLAYGMMLCEPPNLAER